MSSSRRRWLLAFALMAPSAVVSQQPRRAPHSGSWIVGVLTPPDTMWLRFTLRFDRDAITGTNGSGDALTGVVHGDSIRFALTRRDDGWRVAYAGVMRGDTLRGTRVETPKDAKVPPVTQTFFATADIAARAPRRVAFEPKVFHRAFSGAVVPALRIIPGDTVRTWSVDAGGVDSTGTQRSPGGNPLTGPFFVEGALPGDVIAIHLHRVRLNRDWAHAGSDITYNSITPDYVRDMKEVDDFDSRWRLDRARGVAMLEHPTPRLAAYTVAMHPMLGCIGVAPSRDQVIRTGDSGPYGGNMDYNAIREGATVYLPVFKRGALLFLGDGHAAQGDGELTGDALETSMNIEFSVDVLHGRRISTPLAEDAEYVMSIGISGDLTDALRQATTGLSRWIEQDYALNNPELASLLGTSLRYDVADLIGTQVSIVAKLPKKALERLKRMR